MLLLLLLLVMGEQHERRTQSSVLLVERRQARENMRRTLMGHLLLLQRPMASEVQMWKDRRPMPMLLELVLVQALALLLSVVRLGLEVQQPPTC